MYKIKTIKNNAIYINKADNNLSDLYYLVS